MIVDVHSHAWDPARHFSDDFAQQMIRARGGAANVDLSVRCEDYRREAPPQTKTVVFGGKARLSGLWVDDEHVAQYVAQDPARLFGFLSLDPTQDRWVEDLHRGHQELGLRGIKLMPMYAGFSPDADLLRPMWTYAEKNRLPVLLHTGTTIIAQAPLEHTLPRRLDRVAIAFPEAKIVMAHLAHP